MLSITERLETGFFALNLFFHYHRTILVVGQKVLEQLFASVEVVTPDADALSRGGAVRLYGDLIVELV